MREATFSLDQHANLAPSGAAIIVDPRAMDSLVDRLQGGDPTLGWEGDPRLAVAFNRQTQKWELWRRERDEQYRLVCTSRPGMSFPDNLIQELVSRDVQRGFDPHKYISEYNAKIQAEKDQAADEKIEDAEARVLHAAKREDI